MKAKKPSIAQRLADLEANGSRVYDPAMRRHHDIRSLSAEILDLEDRFRNDVRVWRNEIRVQNAQIALIQEDRNRRIVEWEALSLFGRLRWLLTGRSK